MGYEKYTLNVENILNTYCKKYGYEFSISSGYGREISYDILDGSIVITHIKYNYEWHRWMIYQFDFHIDLDNIIDGIKIPVIHFSNDGYTESGGFTSAQREVLNESVVEKMEEGKSLS